MSLFEEHASTYGGPMCTCDKFHICQHCNHIDRQSRIARLQKEIDIIHYNMMDVDATEESLKVWSKRLDVLETQKRELGA